MRRITLVPYQMSWPEAYERHRARIQSALGDRVAQVDHFGSTAIPGCDAKPIIDILVARRNGEQFEIWQPLMADLGFSHARLDSTGRGEGQWFFRDPARTVHIHVYEAGTWGHVRHLAFRDALLQDDALRSEYVALKRALAQREWATVDGYIDAKEEFVRRVETRLRDDQADIDNR